MTSVALPRARARRRRLKPPPPSFWRALLSMLWDVCFLVANAYFARRGSILNLIVVPIAASSLVLWSSRTFAREWRAWRDQ